MSERLKTILFALALCLVCSTLLTAAATRLQPLQAKNMQLDRRKNILLAINRIDPSKPYAPDEINRLYEETIFQYAVNSTGAIVDPLAETAQKSKVQDQDRLPLYLAVDPETQTIRSYIIPIDTRGLWGKIYGYLALKDDGATIEGFSVYKHAETPGLGGEIETHWFQRNFVGKKIVDQSNQFVSVSVAKGRASDQVPETKLPNYVDGISGATLTGQYLSKGLREILADYEPASIRFRQDMLACRVTAKTPWCDHDH